VHTLEKSALKDVVREIDASLMPSYASRLKDAELDDLVAYLSTLRGTK
jgi:mono/diheme cytochrome c family protein